MDEIGHNNGHTCHAANQDARDGVADVFARLREPTAHITLFDQAVKMQAVRVAGVQFFDLAAVDAEQDFCDGVHANDQCGKGRHKGVALNQHDSKPGQ